MRLDIPFFSQLDDQVPTDLQRSVCAIACLKMVLDHKGVRTAFADLLSEANIVGGREHAGWTHETIVRVLRNHGVHAYRQEFKAHAIDLETGDPAEAAHSGEFALQGIEKIRRCLEAGNPTFVSVSPGFGANLGDHVVLVVGYEGDSLSILDPQQPPGSNPVTVSTGTFLAYWKRLAIFVE